MSLELNVKILNGAAAALALALLSLCAFFIIRIDDRFDRVDEPVRQVQMTVAAQTETLKTIDRRLERMEEKRESAPPPKATK